MKALNGFREKKTETIIYKVVFKYQWRKCRTQKKI